jgi:hypothetical protein
MSQPNGYGQALRVIGQALEILKIDTFEMENEGDDYFVRGNLLESSRRPMDGGVAAGTIEYVWGIEPGLTSQINRVKLTAPGIRVHLCYMRKDVDRLEQGGRTKRSATPGITQVDGLSELLRTIGAYLDQKSARLLKITRDGDSLSIQYETASGQRSEEILSASSLYDFWIEMCMRRAKQANT